jgi:hypothetical protein
MSSSTIEVSGPAIQAAALNSLGPSEYLAQRVEDQINWYDGKGGWNQRWYKLLRVVEIVAAALIPFLTAVPAADAPYMKFVIAVLGVLITVVAGILALFQFQERWTDYRATAESLKRERFLFLTRAEPYAAGDSFSTFVQRIEALISKENTNWSQSFARPEKGDGGQKA